MNPFENVQPNAQEFFERITEANKKAWELSSDYMKKDFERQSSYFNEMAEAGRSFYGDVAKTVQPTTGSAEDITKQFETLQQRYSEIVKEQTAAFQELQNQLKDIYAPVLSAPEQDKAKGKAK